METAMPGGGGAAGAAALAGGRLVARAVLLGERLDLRGVAAAEGGLGDPVQLAAPEGLVTFASRWGAVTLIGGTAELQAALLAELRPRVSEPLSEPVEESALLAVGADEDGIDPRGAILLEDASLPRLALVADALAKSAALAHQETTLTGTTDAMEPFVAALATTGRFATSTRALQRTIGAALSARSRATTRVQADGKPDLLWDHPELERLFERLVDQFELEERSAALDRKLGLIGETTTTFSTLVQARRTYLVELAIVLLILIEVVKGFCESLAV
ncbi:MAG: RMD1 family protein [Geminicoccaceae bacterium]|nr:RMD1 family protein [Geminicoccaceae bacterium]